MNDKVTTLPKGESMPDILNSVKQARRKAAKESAEAKVAAKMKIREEHQKALDLIDEEITNIVEEFEKTYAS